jgi:hypothetical protein
MNTYPTTKKAKTKEVNIIQDMLHSNGYNKNLSIRHSKQQKHGSAPPKNEMGYFYI